MKQSGIDWIGEIPDDWKTRQIRYLFSLRDERNYKPLSEVNLISVYTDKGVLQHSDIEQTTGNKAQNADGYKHVYKNDLVVNIILCWMGALGISDFDGVTSPAYDVYAPKDLNTILPKYYHYLFRTPQFNGKCYTEGRGIMQMRWRTYSSEFKSIKVPLPPKATQQRIAEYLDKKVSEIDSIIEESKKSIEEYKAWKQSVIFEAVTGKNLSCKKKDSSIEWIGEIPEGWEITTIKQLYNVTLGKMIAPKQTSDLDTLENYLCAANIKWLGVNTEVNKQMYFNDLEKEEYLLIPGDVLLMEGGLAGTACIYQNEFSPCYMQNSVLRCRCKTIGYNKYLYYWLFAIYHVGYIDSICNRATIQHYTKEKVENTPILVNAISEQETIAKMLDSKCAQIDSLIAEKESLITDLTEYKKSLIFEVVTGKRSV